MPIKTHDWRLVITDMESTTIQVLDRIARNRSFDYQLCGPSAINFDVPSFDERINATWAGDGFPKLTEGDRLVYAFRRDYDGDYINNDPWQCRAAGTILNVTDKATEDIALTSVKAFDPWQRLYYLPVITPTEGAIQGTTDTFYADTPANEIIIDLLVNAEFFGAGYSYAGSGKIGIDYGQFGPAPGTIEVLPSITQTFQAEMSIGEAFDIIVSRDVGDIVLTPVYDPVNRPGILAELNIYARTGVERPTAIFSWDRPPLSITQMERSIDGTQRANKLRFHTGQGGTSNVPGSPPLSVQSNGLSVERFGDYWRNQYIVFDEIYGTAVDFAHGMLHEFGEGKRTVSFDPIPERCPEPFLEFNIGDSVRVWSSKQFRAAQSGYQRISGFTIEASDDNVESIRNMHVYIPPDPLPVGFNANVGETSVTGAYIKNLAARERMRPTMGSWGGR